MHPQSKRTAKVGQRRRKQKRFLEKSRKRLLFDYQSINPLGLNLNQQFR
jgi:hypothetical protein